MAKKNILCPFCFKHFLNTEAEYQCTNNESDVHHVPFCPTEVDRKYNDYWKVETESKHFFKNKSLKTSLFGVTPGSAKCDKCGAESRRFVCPHCHNIIPSEMIELGSEIISVIGAPNSGKTVFFTALMHEMMNKGTWCNLSVTPVTESLVQGEPSTAQIHEKKASDMFKHHILPDKTQYIENQRSIPLIFCLSTKRGYNDTKGKTIYLVFYDTAGEAFEDNERINNIEYVRESSGVIMLLDPYSVPELSATLSGKSFVADEHDVGHIVTQLLGACKKDLKDKPIAMVFSKIDAVINGLEEVGANYEIKGIDLKKNSSFLTKKVMSLAEIDQIDGAIEKVCREKWDLGKMKQNLTNAYSSVKGDSQSDNIKYFGVSSLGCSPEEDKKFTPYRVMDPIFWILHKIGGFDIPVE